MTIRFHRLYEPKRDHIGVNRRVFLKTSVIAGITTATILSGVGSASASTLSQEQTAILLQVAQDIYPHPDLLTIGHYQAIVETVTKNAEADTELNSALQDGLEQIGKSAQSLFGTSYTEIDDPDAREGILRQFQDEGFFQGIRWTAYFAIYNNKDVWPLFGYQGSSAEHGGYIKRGFSDITFVPQGPSLEERKARIETEG